MRVEVLKEIFRTIVVTLFLILLLYFSKCSGLTDLLALLNKYFRFLIEEEVFFW